MYNPLNKPWPILGVCMAWTTLPAIAEADNRTTSTQDSIESVTVTATRLPRPLKDISGIISVVTQDDIEHNLSTHLGDAIRYQPGVVMETANRGGNQGIAIRGIGGNRVLTLVDGVRNSDIYAAGPSSYGSDAYDVDTLHSIEVVRGPLPNVAALALPSDFYGGD
ncbi:MAG: TonB-dependent receptor plug domain-containing protein [Exilibacterium sp.]